MDSFFIPVPLTEVREKTFRDCGLPVIDFSLEQGSKPTIKGFIIQGAENKEKVLEILNTSEIGISSTQYEGVYLVKCKPVSEVKEEEKEIKETISKDPEPIIPIDTKDVIADSDIKWSGKKKELFLSSILKIIYPIVKRNIIVHPHHGKECVPINDGLFHVHLWSSSEKPTPSTIDMPTDILKNKVQCRDWGGFKAGKNDVPLEDKDNKWNFASYTNKNLYIHYDCFHFGNEIEIKTFEDILNFACKYIKDDMDGKNIIEQYISEKRKQSIKALIKICSNRKETRIKELIAGIEEIDRKIISYRAKMIEELDKKSSYNSELYVLENLENTGKETIEKELTFLERMDKIKNIEIFENKLIVHTDLILCKDKRSNKIHEIGEFKIEVDPTGSTGNGGVRFHNLTRKINGNGSNMCAPHVYSDGHACLGNAEPTIVELIKRRAFVELFQYLIAFLETANIEDAAGAHINRWPEVSEETRKKFEDKYGRKLEELY